MGKDIVQQQLQLQQLQQLQQYHPLQRLSSPSRKLSLLLHTAGLASFAYSFNFLIAHPSRVNQSYGWHFQYLTIIGLTLATVTFATATLADLSRSRALFALKNWVSVCATPLEVLIWLLYWGLRLIDPALVVPQNVAQLPLGADLSFHLVPALVLVLDLLLLSPPWTITVAPAIALSGSIALAYWCWIELCFRRNGFYPYPLFALLDGPQRTVLFAASAVIMAANTALLQWLYARVNGVLPRLPAPLDHALPLLPPPPSEKSVARTEKSVAKSEKTVVKTEKTVAKTVGAERSKTKNVGARHQRPSCYDMDSTIGTMLK